MYLNKKKLFISRLRELPKKVEIGILFGGYEMIPYRADAAIELYKNNKVKKILVSGGIGYLNKNRREKEADILFQYLVGRGIPKENIIIEDKSKNTYQNIKNSYDIIKSKYKKDVDIVLITSDFHLKRCFLISKMFFKNDNIYGYSVKCSKYKKSILLRELALLNYYSFKFKGWNSL